MITPIFLLKLKNIVVLLILVNFLIKTNSQSSWQSLKDCLKEFPEFERKLHASGFGGKPAKKHEFPHAVAIGWTETDQIKWTCGGSLITENFIVTAAHCTSNRAGVAPDVVRLGDLNLKTDDDEKETQQYKISQIIRHPEFTSKRRYHDLALLKLSSSVNITTFVAPPCLWSNNEVQKDMQLEACGFGQTEYGGPISPILNKIVVSPVGRAVCSEHYDDDRKLPDGIVDSHLCANDKTGQRMDTCEGDSGGPLEMKLQLVHKIVPFIVGITAFGKGCGFYSPGVYTRISSHLDWIKSLVPDIITNPLECAQKYQEYRYNEPYGSLSYENNPQKDVLSITEDEKCAAILLTHTYLVASAACVKKMVDPNYVRVSYPPYKYQVDQIIYHPDFNIKTQNKANVALIRVASEIKWHQEDYPTCMSEKNPEEFSLLIQNEVYSINYGWGFRKTIEKNISYCLDYYGVSLSDFDNDTLCFDTEKRHVPTACEVPTGSAITALSDHPSKSLTRGLALYSKDCGPVLATNLAKYIDWMDSIIFQNRVVITKADDDEFSVLYFDKNIELNDTCSLPGTNVQGHCIEKEQCTVNIVNSYLICGKSGSMVCCPNAHHN